MLGHRGSSAAVQLPDNLPTNRIALRQLRWRWAGTALVYGAFLLGGYWLLRNAWTPAWALWWSGWAGLTMLIELSILWWILPNNHPPAATDLLPTFGYGTDLTLICGLLLFLLAGFLFAPRPPGWLAWLPALLYTVARLVDYFDGYLARITQHETKLGSILDMELDGFGVLIAILLGIQYGALPLWYLPLALSRQLFIFGIWLRTRRGLPVYEMTPSANRRIVAGYQTGFLSLALWPSFRPPLSTLAATIFALPLLASFGRDWLVVSGALDPASERYQRGRALVKDLLEGWLPLLARIVGFGLAAYLLGREIPTFPTWLPYLQSVHWTAPTFWLWLLALVCIPAAIAMLLGVLGRVVALPLMALAWLDVAANGLDWSDNAWLFMAAAIVTHAGSGRWALWRPEDPVLHTRPGVRQDA
ncbi:MAG: CDP-alcohol phosphatidyltransferase family protein [Caldilineaceae bacterium]|nr:CDP-alcohol phosphatidyltransferase family protein [Caldilineaceae bacterium]